MAIPKSHYLVQFFVGVLTADEKLWEIAKNSLCGTTFSRSKRQRRDENVLCEIELYLSAGVIHLIDGLHLRAQTINNR